MVRKEKKVALHPMQNCSNHNALFPASHGLHPHHHQHYYCPNNSAAALEGVLELAQEINTPSGNSTAGGRTCFSVCSYCCTVIFLLLSAALFLLFMTSLGNFDDPQPTETDLLLFVLWLILVGITMAVVVCCRLLEIIYLHGWTWLVATNETLKRWTRRGLEESGIALKENECI